MSAAPRFPVVVDGRLHAPGTPVLAAEDQGFALGLAAFETVLVEDGHAYFLADHLARLARGAAGLDIPWPPPYDPRACLATLVEALDPVDRAVFAARVTLSRGVVGRGPTLVVTARTVDAVPAAGVRVQVSSLRKLGDDAVGRLKSTSRVRYVLAREEARRAGAWEALLLTPDGDLSECTVSNVFVVRAGKLRTPSTEHGCLGGLVRARILESLVQEPLEVAGRRLEVSAERIGSAELGDAEEVFLTNTTARVIPVSELTGAADQPLAYPGARGVVTRAVRARIDELEARDREPRA